MSAATREFCNFALAERCNRRDWNLDRRPRPLEVGHGAGEIGGGDDGQLIQAMEIGGDVVHEVADAVWGTTRFVAVRELTIDSSRDYQPTGKDRHARWHQKQKQTEP